MNQIDTAHYGGSGTDHRGAVSLSMFFAVWLGMLMARVAVEKMEMRTQFTHPTKANPHGPRRTGGGGMLYYSPTMPLCDEIWPRKRRNSSDVGESGDGPSSQCNMADLGEITETR